MSLSIVELDAQLAAANERIRKLEAECAESEEIVRKFEAQLIAEREVSDKLVEALLRMGKMHALMMAQVNHGASFYQAECLREMNSAPIQAACALAERRCIRATHTNREQA